MNIGFWSCIILVIPFVIIGVLFAIFKEKATKFVSGFNSFSKEEQAMYDKAQISRDIRNQCFIWTVIMLAGATLSCFLTPYMAIPTYIIWLVLFFIASAIGFTSGNESSMAIVWLCLGSSFLCLGSTHKKKENNTDDK